MSECFFQFKRVYWSSILRFRGELRQFDRRLTQARFDLLVAVYVHPLQKYSSQTQLANALGVHRMTVSRMAASLEDLGWVCREMNSEDIRKTTVELSAEGLALVLKIIRWLQEGIIALCVLCICVPAPCSPQSQVEAMARLKRLLLHIRDQCRDGASRAYPPEPHPAEIDEIRWYGWRPSGPAAEPREEIP